MTADRFLTDIAKKSVPDALTPAWSLTALLDLLPSEIKNGSRTYSFRMNKVGMNTRYVIQTKTPKTCIQYWRTLP